MKDRRIDKMAQKRGYSSYQVFCSPIVSSLVFAVAMPIVTIGLSVFLLDLWYIYMPAYLLLVYLIAAYLNNSFIIAKDELLVINPNFPFRRFKKYTLANIQQVDIEQSWGFSSVTLFGKTNNVIVTTPKGYYIYCCESLEEDYYDRNTVESTIDDFEYSLRSKKVIVNMNID